MHELRFDHEDPIGEEDDQLPLPVEFQCFESGTTLNTWEDISETPTIGGISGLEQADYCEDFRDSPEASDVNWGAWGEEIPGVQYYVPIQMIPLSSENEELADRYLTETTDGPLGDDYAGFAPIDHTILYESHKMQQDTFKGFNLDDFDTETLTHFEENTWTDVPDDGVGADEEEFSHYNVGMEGDQVEAWTEANVNAFWDDGIDTEAFVPEDFANQGPTEFNLEESIGANTNIEIQGIGPVFPGGYAPKCPEGESIRWNVQESIWECSGQIGFEQEYYMPNSQELLSGNFEEIEEDNLELGFFIMPYTFEEDVPAPNSPVIDRAVESLKDTVAGSVSGSDPNDVTINTINTICYLGGPNRVVGMTPSDIENELSNQDEYFAEDSIQPPSTNNEGFVDTGPVAVTGEIPVEKVEEFNEFTCVWEYEINDGTQDRTINVAEGGEMRNVASYMDEVVENEEMLGKVPNPGVENWETVDQEEMSELTSEWDHEPADKTISDIITEALATIFG